MNDRNMLRVGLGGGAIAAICCFTPVLVILLAGAGLSAIVGWLDYALFPLLFASLGLVAYALYIRAGRAGPSPKALVVVAVAGLSALIVWLEFRFALRLSIAAAAAVAAYAFYLHRRQGKTPAGPRESLS